MRGPLPRRDARSTLAELRHLTTVHVRASLLREAPGSLAALPGLEDLTLALEELFLRHCTTDAVPVPRGAPERLGRPLGWLLGWGPSSGRTCDATGCGCRRGWRRS